MSGTVTKGPGRFLLGNTIEIEHSKGIVTRYQSVKDFEVAVGDVVEQGQAIAKAGKSLFNEEAGVHVHFEIRKADVAVNPLEYFNKSLATLQEAQLEDKKCQVNNRMLKHQKRMLQKIKRVKTTHQKKRHS